MRMVRRSDIDAVYAVAFSSKHFKRIAIYARIRTQLLRPLKRVGVDIADCGNVDRMMWLQFAQIRKSHPANANARMRKEFVRIPPFDNGGETGKRHRDRRRSCSLQETPPVHSHNQRYAGVT